MSEDKIVVEHWNDAKDGELTANNVRRKLEREGYNVIEYVFEPGTTFPDHTHGVSKKDAIASGQFRFSMFGQEVVLQPGDMVSVPKHTVHNASVVGSKSVIFFDATK